MRSLPFQHKLNRSPRTWYGRTPDEVGSGSLGRDVVGAVVATPAIVGDGQEDEGEGVEMETSLGAKIALPDESVAKLI